jgi:hypothetical protein
MLCYTKYMCCHLSINLLISLGSIYKDRYLGVQDRKYISAATVFPTYYSAHLAPATSGQKYFFTPAYVSITEFKT